MIKFIRKGRFELSIKNENMSLSLVLNCSFLAMAGYAACGGYAGFGFRLGNHINALSCQLYKTQKIMGPLRFELRTSAV